MAITQEHLMKFVYAIDKVWLQVAKFRILALDYQKDIEQAIGLEKTNEEVLHIYAQLGKHILGDLINLRMPREVESLVDQERFKYSRTRKHNEKQKRSRARKKLNKELNEIDLVRSILSFWNKLNNLDTGAGSFTNIRKISNLPQEMIKAYLEIYPQEAQTIASLLYNNINVEFQNQSTVSTTWDREPNLKKRYMLAVHEGATEAQLFAIKLQIDAQEALESTATQREQSSLSSPFPQREQTEISSPQTQREHPSREQPQDPQPEKEAENPPKDPEEIENEIGTALDPENLKSEIENLKKQLAELKPKSKTRKPTMTQREQSINPSPVTQREQTPKENPQTQWEQTGSFKSLETATYINNEGETVVETFEENETDEPDQEGSF